MCRFILLTSTPQIRLLRFVSPQQSRYTTFFITQLYLWKSWDTTCAPKRRQLVFSGGQHLGVRPLFNWVLFFAELSRYIAPRFYRKMFSCEFQRTTNEKSNTFWNMLRTVGMSISSPRIDGKLLKHEVSVLFIHCYHIWVICLAIVLKS